MEPANVDEYEAAAAELLDPAAYGYFAGGAGDEVTLRDNVEAFRRWQLRPRVLVDVGDAATADDRARRASSRCPVLVAPVAYQRVAHPDGEVAMARAAAAAGTVMCLSTLATSTPEDVAATGAARWSQLYVFRDRGFTRRARRPRPRRRLHAPSSSPSTRRCSAAASATCGAGSRSRRTSRCPRSAAAA